jgi:serine protease Do
MAAGSRRIDRRWLLSLLLAAAGVSFLPAFGTARAEGLDSSAQRRLREATFEVVVEKPASDPLSYEKTLPLELLPYAERVGKYRPLGTAFAIGHDRFVTAAHVITAGMGSPKGSLALRDQNGKTFLVDRIVKFSGAEDYAVFTLLDSPRVSALDTHERPALNDPVFAVGDALGEGIIIRDGLYTSDTPEEREGRWKWIRFSAAASPGNSGGPLVDRKGRVIGVVLRKSPNENLNVAVAIDQVLKGTEQSATFEGRSAYRFPMMRESDATDVSEQFPLPKPIDEFYAAQQKVMMEMTHKMRAQYESAHGDRIFPRGADSQQLLHSLHVAGFPRIIEERSDGIWGVSDPKPQRSQLDQNGFVETAASPLGTLVRVRMPDNARWPDLFGSSKSFMDLVLKGTPLQRQVGTDAVRITSLGGAALDTTHVDKFGRTWQLRAWYLPFDDTVILSIALPTPQGYIGIVTHRPHWFEEIGLEELRSYTGFVYFSLVGTLKQWQDYMAAPLAQPDAVHALAIECEYGKTFRFRSKRFNLTLASGLPRVEADSVLTLKFSYFNDGDNTVWDVGGLYLGDPERKNNGIDILRRQRPLPSFPEAMTDQWHKIENAEHPYTGIAYSTDGATRIESIQDLKDIAAQHRSVAYTLAVVAEGTQDQATMKRALDAAQRGLTVLERN